MKAAIPFLWGYLRHCVKLINILYLEDFHEQSRYVMKKDVVQLRFYIHFFFNFKWKHSFFVLRVRQIINIWIMETYTHMKLNFYNYPLIRKKSRCRTANHIGCHEFYTFLIVTNHTVVPCSQKIDIKLWLWMGLLSFFMYELAKVIVLCLVESISWIKEW